MVVSLIFYIAHRFSLELGLGMCTFFIGTSVDLVFFCLLLKNAFVSCCFKFATEKSLAFDFEMECREN